MGFILSTKSSLARHLLEPIIVYQKLGDNFGTSSFHFSNFERLIKPKIGYAHEIHCSKSHIHYARLAWLTHPSRTS